MHCPRTRLDELMLYVLCVLYRRHCIVYTKWQPWHTVNPESELSLNMIEEMCETKLLFIGENLYGVLRRLPLERPIIPPIVLADVHAGRLLTWDLSNNIHLTITGVSKQQRPEVFTPAMGSDSLSETNVTATVTGKTASSPERDSKSSIKKESNEEGMLHFDIFSDTYAAYLSAPKTEPTDSQVSAENWNITDVHTIGTAVKEENLDSITRIDPNCVIHGKDLELNMDSLQDATLCENVLRLQPDPLQEATPCEVSHSIVVQDSHLSPINILPLLDELPVHEPQPIPVATLHSETFHDKEHHEEVLRDTTPIESDSTDMSNKKVSENKDYPNVSVLSDVYYSVLTLSQDDIIYIHHKDILKRTCKVELFRLSQSEVENAALSQTNDYFCGTFRNDRTLYLKPASAKEKDTQIDDPDWPPKKVKKHSNRPGLKPSSQRIAAQKVIEQNNKKRKRKDYTPVKILVITTCEPTR